MARRKNTKSLFEVISRDATRTDKADKAPRQPLGVPGWFGRAQAAEPASPEAPVVPGGKDVPAPAGRPALSTGEPILSVGGGRLRVSLNQVSAAVVVLGIALLLVAAFFLGRRTAPTRVESPAAPVQAGGEDLAGQPPGRGPPPLPKQGEVGPKPPAQGPTQPAPRQKQFWYLVIQAGISTRAQAEDIQAFLRDYGVFATVHRSQHTRKWMVRDLKGCADRRAKDALAYKDQIEQLGKVYFQPGRGRLYDFLGCYYSLEQ